MGVCFSEPEDELKQHKVTKYLRDSAYESDDDATCSEDSSESLLRHAFLSHSRGTSEDDGSDVHEMVSKINSYLNSKGLKTLFEEDKMNIEAIDHARFIVIFATRKYFDPVNYSLDKELVRRYVKRKGLDRVIVVVMEKSLRDNESWEGPLGLQLRGLSFIDLSEYKVFRRQICNELLTQLLVPDIDAIQTNATSHLKRRGQIIRPYD